MTVILTTNGVENIDLKSLLLKLPSEIIDLIFSYVNLGKLRQLEEILEPSSSSSLECLIQQYVLKHLYYSVKIGSLIFTDNVINNKVSNINKGNDNEYFDMNCGNNIDDEYDKFDGHEDDQIPFFQDCFEFIDKCNNSQGLISPHILNFENIGDLIILSMKTKTSTIITRLLQNKQINVSARLLDGIIPRHLHNTNYPIDYHLQNIQINKLEINPLVFLALNESSKRYFFNKSTDLIIINNNNNNHTSSASSFIGLNEMYMILSVINSIGGNINELITRNEYNNNNLMTLPLPNLIKKLAITFNYYQQRNEEFIYLNINQYLSVGLTHLSIRFPEYFNTINNNEEVQVQVQNTAADANADANANDDDDKMIIDFQRFINLKYLKFYDITFDIEFILPNDLKYLYFKNCLPNKIYFHEFFEEKDLNFNKLDSFIWESPQINLDMVKFDNIDAYNNNYYYLLIHNGIGLKNLKIPQCMINSILSKIDNSSSNQITDSFIVKKVVELPSSLQKLILYNHTQNDNNNEDDEQEDEHEQEDEQEDEHEHEHDDDDDDVHQHQHGNIDRYCFHFKYLFPFHSNLTSLTVDGVNVVNFHNFDNLINLKTLNIYNQFKSCHKTFDYKLPISLTRLIFDHCHYQQYLIDNSTNNNNLYNLKYVQITNCGLNNIDQSILKLPDNVEELNLNNNCIGIIDNPSNQNQNQNQNQEITIDKIFPKNLKTLHLCYNQLMHVKSLPSSLISLYLSHNQLNQQRFMEPSTLVLSNLKHLDLSYNIFNLNELTTTDSFLQSTTNLETLNLSSNLTTTTTAITTTNITNINTNSIVIGNCFPSSLIELKLSYNNLKYLISGGGGDGNGGGFEQFLPNLQHIDLSGNLLGDSLNKGFLQTWKNLYHHQNEQIIIIDELKFGNNIKTVNLLGNRLSKNTIRDLMNYQLMKNPKFRCLIIENSLIPQDLYKYISQTYIMEPINN